MPHSRTFAGAWHVPAWPPARGSTRERYRLGISTFIEMREAQQSLADATSRLIQARYNTKVAEIELLRLRGDIVR